MNNLIRLRDGVAEVCRDDPWQLLRELPDALPPGPLLLPLAAWLERRGEAGAAAPWLAPDDEVEALLPHFAELLSHMRQCGFDAFAVREDKNVEDALKGLAGLSVLYGCSAIEPRPLFRRR